MPSASSAVVFQNVHCRRAPGTDVLRGFDLSVKTGEVFVLVGRSGTGKTTILKLINRLLLPDSGSVLVEECDTRKWEPFELRRHCGFVLQEVALFPHMTIAENVGLVPTLAGWSRERTDARVRELLDLVDLPSAQFAQRWPQELSGGQRQRVGVARALAIDPPILLMDEPFGALDPITRLEMHHEFRRIQARVRKTVMIVTHDMGEAFALADRLGVLAEGRLVACDTPARIARLDEPHVRLLMAAVQSGPENK